MPYDLHIVRTSHWLDAANSPIVRSEVDTLLESDPELAWSTTDYVDMQEAGHLARYWFGRYKIKVVKP